MELSTRRPTATPNLSHPILQLGGPGHHHQYAIRHEIDIARQATPTFSFSWSMPAHYSIAAQGSSAAPTALLRRRLRARQRQHPQPRRCRSRIMPKPPTHAHSEQRLRRRTTHSNGLKVNHSTAPLWFAYLSPSRAVNKDSPCPPCQMSKYLGTSLSGSHFENVAHPPADQLHIYSTQYNALLTRLILEEPREPDEQDLEDARLEECDLVVVVQTLEAGDELGEGAHLAHVVHETLAELLQERVLRPAFHRTCLKGWMAIISEMICDSS